MYDPQLNLLWLQIRAVWKLCRHYHVVRAYWIYVQIRRKKCLIASLLYISVLKYIRISVCNSVLIYITDRSIRNMPCFIAIWCHNKRSLFQWISRGLPDLFQVTFLELKARSYSRRHLPYKSTKIAIYAYITSPLDNCIVCWLIFPMDWPRNLTF